MLNFRNLKQKTKRQIVTELTSKLNYFELRKKVYGDCCLKFDVLWKYEYYCSTTSSQLQHHLKKKVPLIIVLNLSVYH